MAVVELVRNRSFLSCGSSILEVYNSMQREGTFTKSLIQSSLINSRMKDFSIYAESTDSH